MAKEAGLTPFELRLKMLELSKDLLERQYDLQRDLTISHWNLMVEWARDAKLDIPPIPTFTVAPPTLEDIMTTARQMNNFVSQTFLPVKSAE